jgi:hypothetical protein
VARSRTVCPHDRHDRHLRQSRALSIARDRRRGRVPRPVSSYRRETGFALPAFSRETRLSPRPRSMFSFLSKLLASSAPTSSRRRHSDRPQVEAFADRLAPTGVVSRNCLTTAAPAQASGVDPNLCFPLSRTARIGAGPRCRPSKGNCATNRNNVSDSVYGKSPGDGERFRGGDPTSWLLSPACAGRGRRAFSGRFADRCTRRRIFDLPHASRTRSFSYLNNRSVTEPLGSAVGKVLGGNYLGKGKCGTTPRPAAIHDSTVLLESGSGCHAR